MQDQHDKKRRVIAGGLCPEMTRNRCSPPISYVSGLICLFPWCQPCSLSGHFTCTPLGPENKDMNGIRILQGRGEWREGIGDCKHSCGNGPGTAQSLRGKDIEAHWPGRQGPFCTTGPTSSWRTCRLYQLWWCLYTKYELSLTFHQHSQSTLLASQW